MLTFWNFLFYLRFKEMRVVSVGCYSSTVLKLRRLQCANLFLVHKYALVILLMKCRDESCRCVLLTMNFKNSRFYEMVEINLASWFETVTTIWCLLCISRSPKHQFLFLNLYRNTNKGNKEPSKNSPVPQSCAFAWSLYSAQNTGMGAMELRTAIHLLIFRFQSTIVHACAMWDDWACDITSSLLANICAYKCPV